MNLAAERTPLVGRLGPLNRVAHIFERGQGVLVIKGEAGIGKSRLTEEATRTAATLGWRIAHASCYETEPPISLLPLLGLLRQLDAGDELDALVSVSAEAPSFSPGMSDPRLHLFLAVDRLLRHVTKLQPLVLVLEDVHWADNDTLTLLNYLADQKLTQLVVLLTVRSGAPNSPMLAKLIGKAEAISLGPLDEEETREFILNTCGPVTDPEVSFLHQFTGGNPLFLTELAFCLNESDLLERRTAMELVESRSLPPSVSDLIEFRFSSLANGTQHVLLAASCAGSAFSQDLLVEGLGLDKAEVADAFLAASRADFLRPSEDHPSEVRFSHPLTQEVLLRRLDPLQARRYHAALGHLALVRPGLLTIEQSALHQAKGFRGEELAIALETCTLAAMRAERSLAFEAAAGFWRLALSCVPTAERNEAHAGLLRHLAVVERAAGAWDSALDTLETAYDLYDALGNRPAATQIAYEIGELLRYQLRVAEAADWFIVALSGMPAETDKAACQAMLGSCYIALGRPDEGLELLSGAWRVAERTGSVRPSVARWTAQAVSGAGNPALARQILTTGLDRALALHDSSQAIQLAGSLVFSSLHDLDVEDALEHLALVEAVPEPYDAAALTRVMLCRCLVAAYQGDWLKTRGLARQWAGRVRRSGRFHKATADVLFAEASSVLGRHANALAAIQRARPHLQEMSAMALLHEARFRLRAGDMETARLQVLEAQEQTMADSSPGRRLFLADLAGSLHLEELVGRLYEDLRSETRGMVIVYTPLSVQRVLGKLAAVSENWFTAFEHFELASEMLGENGARYEQAQALLDYADARTRRRRRGDRERAQALRVQALSLFDAMELPRPISALVNSEDRFGLTTREREILFLIARGANNSEVGAALAISIRTVERHLENIFAKMNVANRAQAVVEATNAGLIA